MKLKKLTYKPLILIMAAAIMGSCEPDHETVEVSKISALPRFEYIGGQFNSFVQGTQANFTDPGVIARVGDEEVRVVTIKPSSFNMEEAGIYIIQYFAKNDDGLIARGRRIVAVTYEDVSENDLSGKYLTSTPYGWPPTVSRVRKLHPDGWYSCSDIMGFPGLEMKGEIVDIGRGELFLLPGESEFGAYDLSEGRHTFTSLSWSIILLEEPYSGIEIPVTLFKSDD